VFRALIEVLETVSPAVLVLEDLHWADEQTADFLAYLLSEPPSKLAVVLTFRGEDVDARVRALAAKLPASMTRTDITLAPLDAGQTGALAAAILDAERVSEEFASYLCERTSGLPFAIEELLALLRARGTLVRRGGGWARRALDELDVPSSIRDSVLERAGRLSDDARSVVEAAAVLQVSVPAPVLIATCRLQQPRALRGAEEALESGLLAEHGETIGFRHLLAAQAVYEEIPGPRRRELHGRAAVALESRHPVPLGQVAHHLRHAGRLQEWVAAAERAAEQAAALGHDAEALFGFFPLPNESGRFRVEQEWTLRDTFPRSRQARTVWTFDSAPPTDPSQGGSTTPPFMTLDYVAETDGLSRAEPRRPLRLDLHADHMSGAVAPDRIEAMELWWSVDSGDTWQQSSTKRTGMASFRGTVPGTALRSGESVSLRVAAADAAGNQVDQTVLGIIPVR
jgi:hypothetical protein